jgi:hypothetical protein
VAFGMTPAFVGFIVVAPSNNGKALWLPWASRPRNGASGVTRYVKRQFLVLILGILSSLYVTCLIVR